MSAAECRFSQPAVGIEFSPGNGRGFMLAGFADEQLEVLFETAERFRVALGVLSLWPNSMMKMTGKTLTPRVQPLF
jgi:hypothetical protein